jgi:DNA N-6-adenine-methyltransferase (Dam)
MARAGDVIQVKSSLTIFSESEKAVPSLARMILDARADQQVIKRATQEALRAWFRQSKRLNIARREYKLRGPRFVDFARRIGITDQTSAYQLVHLHRYRAKITSKCVDDAADAAKRGQAYRYPGWETALGWFHKPKRIKRSGRYWLTPPDLYRKLEAEFHFDCDPCPHPLPKGHNALSMEWGQSNYVNPPFSKDDVIGGNGATAFVRKAIEEQQKGKTSVIVLPVFDYVTRLLEAGAEIRPLGRVPFHDVDSRRAAPHPPNIACFVLRGKSGKRQRRP